MNTYELIAQYDARASFYGKAVVLDNGNSKTLLSYGTKVAELNDGKLHIIGKFSQTTGRHIVEFARQNGYSCKSFKDLQKQCPD